MTLLLKQIYSFFKLLNSDTDTSPLAWGLTLGIILGFAPFISIQMGAAFVSAFFFKLIAYFFDVPAHHLGTAVLEAEPLRPLFTALYNMPLVPMTRFNNSIVMGSMIVSLILAPFAYFIFKALIRKYRQLVVARIKNTKIWKAMAASKFYDWYSKYDNLYGQH
jgi:uncharacterized protein (TIGR03546 family)